MQVNEIGDSLSEEERGWVPAESFDEILNGISERDQFAAKTIRNFATQSSDEQREPLTD